MTGRLAARVEVPKHPSLGGGGRGSHVKIESIEYRRACPRSHHYFMSALRCGTGLFGSTPDLIATRLWDF